MEGCMSAIISTNRGGSCSICVTDFSPTDKQFTHLGGEGHDGFHKDCLKKWSIQKSTCPYNCGTINRNDLLSRTERIMAHLRKNLKSAVNAAIGTAFLGFVCTGFAFILPVSIKVDDFALGITAVNGIALATGASQVLAARLRRNPRTLGHITFNNAGIGMIAGAVAGLGVSLLLPKSATVALKSATVALVGGATAGILTLIRA